MPMKPNSTLADPVQHQPQLQLRRDALRQEIESAQSDLRQPRHADEVHDAKDDAQRQQAGAVQSAEIERDWQELQRVEAALQRIATGHYGHCVDCGKHIDPRRLAAEPAAARCLTCETAAAGKAR